MCQQKRQLGGRQMLEIFNNMPFLAEAKRGSSCKPDLYRATELTESRPPRQQKIG